MLDGQPAETLLALEHPPVITLGRGADPRHVLASDAALAAGGVERVRTNRGGDVTYHGPGQLVVYAVVRLAAGIVAHVEALAAAAVAVLEPLGVAARFRRDRPGVWVGDEKICAFGIHVQRRVAIHGLALNLTTTPSAFSLIVPCGLATGVTSVAALRPGLPTPSPEELAPALLAALARTLSRDLEWVSDQSLLS